MRKVAIYARVSTEHDAQLSALENQKDWYKPILSQHTDWELIHMYVDEGITGTSAYKRPNFMQMIQDAENGDFDLIVTREVSRFARNTVDTLQYTRKLKSVGVEVYFINDNIRTFDGDGELRLTIMATLAQEESRKMSIRVKSGQKTSMEKGTLYGNGNILGYDRVGKEMIINPEQAKTVRMIFDWYLSGYGLKTIKFKLEQEHRFTSAGKTIWHEATISHILKNAFYCGIIVYNKEYVPSYLDQKRKINRGQVEQVRVRGTHQPIVSEEDFDKVQKILNSRTINKHGVKLPSNIWTRLLVCSCGSNFKRNVWHRTPSGNQYAYQCYSTVHTGTVRTRLNKGLPTEGICESPMIPEWKLYKMANFIFKSYLRDTDGVLRLAAEMLDKHLDDKEDTNDHKELIESKKQEISKLSKRLDNLIEMRSDGEISREIFLEKQSETTDKISKLQEDLEKLEPVDIEKEDEETHEERLKILQYSLKKLVNFEDEKDVPDEVIDAFTRKIVVYKDHFDWYLRFSPDVKSVQVDGKRENKSKVSSFGYTQDRLPFAKGGNNRYAKIGEIDLSDADHDGRHRSGNWHINIFI